MAEKKNAYLVSQRKVNIGEVEYLHVTKDQSLADMSGRKIPEEPSLVNCGGPRTMDVLEDLDRFTG